MISLNPKINKVNRNVQKLAEGTKKYQGRVLEEMLKLATNAFGLVAALAWNNVIRELVDGYLKPVVGEGSGLISLFIYAVIVTLLAVFITLQLTKLQEIVNGEKK